MFKRILLTLTVVCTMAFTVPAYAAPEETATAAPTKDNVSKEKVAEEIAKSADKPATDYYADKKYDTDGNASLINNQQIIYNSEEMQFISVTTKDGHVFYVLINYSDADQIDNVYFLNKVDDYDLYALLYGDSEDEDNNTTPEKARKEAEKNNSKATEDSGDEQKAAVSDNDKEEAPKEEADTAKTNTTISTTYIYLVGGIFVVIVLVIMFMAKKKKPKQNQNVYDFDDDDDVEINEDEE